MIQTPERAARPRNHPIAWRVIMVVLAGFMVPYFSDRFVAFFVIVALMPRCRR
jgi:hypothetical protein